MITLDFQKSYEIRILPVDNKRDGLFFFSVYYYIENGEKVYFTSKDYWNQTLDFKKKDIVCGIDSFYNCLVRGDDIYNRKPKVQLLQVDEEYHDKIIRTYLQDETCISLQDGTDFLFKLNPIGKYFVYLKNSKTPALYLNSILQHVTYLYVQDHIKIKKI